MFKDLVVKYTSTWLKPFDWFRIKGNEIRKGESLLIERKKLKRRHWVWPWEYSIIRQRYHLGSEGLGKCWSQTPLEYRLTSLHPIHIHPPIPPRILSPWHIEKQWGFFNDSATISDSMPSCNVGRLCWAQLLGNWRRMCALTWDILRAGHCDLSHFSDWSVSSMRTSSHFRLHCVGLPPCYSSTGQWQHRCNIL